MPARWTASAGPLRPPDDAETDTLMVSRRPVRTARSADSRRPRAMHSYTNIESVTDDVTIVGLSRLSGAPRERCRDTSPGPNILSTSPAADPRLSAFFSDTGSVSGSMGLGRLPGADPVSRAGRRRARRAHTAVALTGDDPEQDSPAAYPVMKVDWSDAPEPEPVATPRTISGRLAQQTQAFGSPVMSSPELRPPAPPDSRRKNGERPDLDAILERAARRRHTRLMHTVSAASSADLGSDRSSDAPEPHTRRRFGETGSSDRSSDAPEPYARRRFGETGSDRSSDAPEPQSRRRRDSGSSEMSAAQSVSSERSSRSGGEPRETLSSRHQRMRARQRSAGRVLDGRGSPEPDPEPPPTRRPPRTISGRLKRQTDYGQALSSPDLWRQSNTSSAADVDRSDTPIGDYAASPVPTELTVSGSPLASSERWDADWRQKISRRKPKPAPIQTEIVDSDSAPVPSADTASPRDFPVSRRKEIASPWSRLGALSPASDSAQRRHRLPDVLADLSSTPQPRRCPPSPLLADADTASDMPAMPQRRRTSLNTLTSADVNVEGTQKTLERIGRPPVSGAVSSPLIPAEAARGYSLPRQFRSGTRSDVHDLSRGRRAVSQSGSPDRMSVTSTGSERPGRERGRSRSPRCRITQLKLRPRRVSQSPDTRAASVSGAPISRSMLDLRCRTPSQEDVWHSVLRAAGVETAVDTPPLAPAPLRLPQTAPPAPTRPPRRGKPRSESHTPSRRRVDENRNRITGDGSGGSGSGSGSCTSCGAGAGRRASAPSETVVVQLADISGFLQQTPAAPGSITDTEAGSVDLELELEPQPDTEVDSGDTALGRQTSAARHNLIEFGSMPGETQQQSDSAAANLARGENNNEATDSEAERLRQHNLSLENQLLKSNLKVKNLEALITTIKESSMRAQQTAERYSAALAAISVQVQALTDSRDERYRNLATERDEARQEVANIEAMFSDLHRKYERCKQELQQQRQLGDQLAMAQRQSSERADCETARYDLLQNDAEQALERLRTENLRLTMKLRLSDNKISKLEDDNQQLTNMCDELIQKMGAQH